MTEQNQSAGDPPKNDPPKNDPPRDDPPKDGGLDAILGKLDEEGRKAVRSELTRARDEAARYRTKANKFGDMDPEKAKQALTKLNEIEEQNKTDAQKAADRATAAEKVATDARIELLRERIGRKHSLSETFTALLQGTDEDTMNAHAEKLAAELTEVRKRPGDAVPTTPKSSTSPGAGDSDDPFDPKKIAIESLANF